MKSDKIKIQYCSDLHLEFQQNRRFLQNNPLIVSGDILILAGDIIPLHDEFFNNSFFPFISKNYKKVYWVPGNHEFYYKDINEFSNSYNINLRENIHIVNNIKIEDDDISYIFTTLWSNISKNNETTIEQSVSDFDCITKNKRKLKAKDFNELHFDSLLFLKNALNQVSKKTIIVSHHLPSPLCNSREHKNSSINEAFCVNLNELINESNVNFWIYGHSHFNSNPVFLNNTILLTNQLGYVHENEHSTFKRNAYISI